MTGIAYSDAIALGGNRAPQVTDMFYNWQDEQVATEQVVGTSDDPIVVEELNNLGQETEEQDYDGKNVTVTDSNGNPQIPSGERNWWPRDASRQQRRR